MNATDTVLINFLTSSVNSISHITEHTIYSLVLTTAVLLIVAGEAGKVVGFAITSHIRWCWSASPNCHHFCRVVTLHCQLSFTGFNADAVDNDDVWLL
jgi:hypothetical protein